MIPRERARYSAIVDRPKLALPNGNRVAIWTIVNLEVWDISRPMPRVAMPPPLGQPLLPDVANWSWHEYGMRVGVWRFFELFERLGIRPTVSINARVCEDYERVAAQARDGGWEFMAHAYEQVPVQKIEDRRGMIHKTLDVLEAFTGERPVGWLGPGLTETFDTPDLLAEAGIRYIADWVYDDEPTRISTSNGVLTTLPYTVELNDIATMVLQGHELPYWATKCKDAFDRYYLEGKERAKILSIAIHPYVSAQPHRIRYLEAVYDYLNNHLGVAHMNGREILDWYNSQIAPP